MCLCFDADTFHPYAETYALSQRKHVCREIFYISFLFETRERTEEKRREEKRREEKCCDEMRRAEQRSIQRRRKGKRIDVKRKAIKEARKLPLARVLATTTITEQHNRRNRDTKTRQRTTCKPSLLCTMCLCFDADTFYPCAEAYDLSQRRHVCREIVCLCSF